MALVNFGNFQIDLEERRIYTTTGELPVEPKVVDVLCYLIRNSDRFVSLQELHAEVWSGRVVTDTAVRRTVSKLRAVLGDTDTEAPLFIKSQMKRGYQFIGQVLPVELSTTEFISSDSADDSTKLQTNEISSVSRKKLARSRYGLFSALLLAIVFWSYQLVWETRENPVLTNEPIVSIAGEKYYLSVSENGRYQAFTGRLNKNEGWQPYLYDRQLGQLQKVYRSPKAYTPFVSVVNNETVIVSAVEDGQSKLYLYAISNLDQAQRVISLQDFSRIGQVVSYQDKVVLLNGQRHSDNNLVYYLLNLEDETVKQFTFSALRDSIDLGATLSPDQQYFAFIRRGINYQVQILRTADKSLLTEEAYEFSMIPNDEMNLLWLDHQRLLINIGSEFEILNVANRTKQQLSQSERFSSLGRDQAGNLFGLLKKPKKISFYQVQLTDLSSIQRYYSFNDHAISLSYSQTPDTLWLVEQDQTGYLLQQYQPKTGEKKLYFKSKAPFSVIDDQPDSANLLLQFSHHQLKMLDYDSGKVTEISDINQKISFATFAGDNKVFFSERIGEEWQINVFDRESLSQTRVLKGYRLIWSWNQQFVAVDAEGQFYLLDHQHQPVKALQLSIDFKLRHQVSLRGNTLIIANIGVDSLWRLTTLDLLSGQQQHQVSDTLPIKTSFSFNNESTSAVLMAENDIENQLVKLGYNLGYN